jgi:hypothetical protein
MVCAEPVNTKDRFSGPLDARAITIEGYPNPIGGPHPVELIRGLRIGVKPSFPPAKKVKPKKSEKEKEYKNPGTHLEE